MALANLHLEKITIPENYQQIIHKHKYWHEDRDGFELQITKETKDGRIFYKYSILIYTSNDIFEEYEQYVRSSINLESYHERSKDKNLWWAIYLMQMLEEIDKELYDSETVTVNAPIGWKTAHISTTDLNEYKRLRTHISTIVRELSQKKYETTKTLFQQALEYSTKISGYTAALSENMEIHVHYIDLWNDAAMLLEKWGVNTDTVELLAVLYCIPRRDYAKAIEELVAGFKIKSKLKKDKTLYEKLFLALQQNIENHFIDYKEGYPRKATIKRVAKKLAFAFRIFGYGIHTKGLITIIRQFWNDGEEYISSEIYKSNKAYNKGDRDYDDETEKLNDKFWKKYKIEEMIK